MEDFFTVGACLFVASSVWITRRRRKQRRMELTPHAVARHRESISKTSDLEGKVGSRGIAALTPPIPYLDGFLKYFEDPCDADTNPTGHIALCVAENKLITDLLAKRLLKPGTAETGFSDSTAYYYNSFLGMPVAREALAYFLARRFLFPETPITTVQALQHIHPGDVAIAAGCASLLNSLFFLLGEEGDACLIPAPYYAAFEHDMSVVGGVVPCSVLMANPAKGPSVTDLELAWVQARSKGLTPKFILLTNPNNPLGVIYSPEVIRGVVEWARKRMMHTIVDEIYALSHHKKYNHGFQSVIRVLDNKLGDDVHMLWALSKDFGASGMRYGTIYSQNKTFMLGLANLCVFQGVSGPIQLIVSELLTDDEFVESFLDEARNRTFASYKICVTKLQEMVLPFVPAEAGMFVYVDFSSLLPKKTFEWERKLTGLMLQYACVVLTPGESQRDESPGMFRICYAWVSPDVLEIAMERLSRLVAKIRRMDWDDLDSRTLGGIL